MMNRTLHQNIVSESYRSPVVFALALQIPIALLCLLMLDGGHLAKICGVAMSANWLVVLLVMSRRPHAPTAADLAFIRLGFLALFVPLIFLHGLLR